MTLNCTKVLQSKHRYIEIIRIENEVEMWIEWEIRCKTNKMANCGHVTGCWTTLDSKSLYSNTFYIWTRCYLLLLLLISFFFVFFFSLFEFSLWITTRILALKFNCSRYLLFGSILSVFFLRGFVLLSNEMKKNTHKNSDNGNII